eukprot:COSAG01_NODE_855_length_13088_cov_13.421511_6_plen_65_part_00
MATETTPWGAAVCDTIYEIVINILYIECQHIRPGPACACHNQQSAAPLKAMAGQRPLKAKQCHR